MAGQLSPPIVGILFVERCPVSSRLQKMFLMGCIPRNMELIAERALTLTYVTIEAQRAFQKGGGGRWDMKEALTRKGDTRSNN